jgi:hypothetical protein
LNAFKKLFIHGVNYWWTDLNQKQNEKILFY